jgi:hypothetical protein
MSALPIEGLEEIDLKGVLTGIKVPDAHSLEALLQGMNEAGQTPTLVGLDRNGERFLAYLYEVGGEETYPAVVTDDPRSTSFDYSDVGRCADCGAFGRRELMVLAYPVLVI